MYQVSHLRGAHITRDTIIYKWWFRKQAALALIRCLLPYVDVSRIRKKIIEGEEYYLLYVGKAKNGHGRLVDYHILDKNRFHESGVLNGRLSSLRQTLSALLNIDMSDSKDAIDTLIDEHCMVDYELVGNRDVLELEKQAIVANYPVLNSQNTRAIFSKEHRRTLSQLKKQFRH